MEKQKENKRKLGTGDLTKKERRAQKVQAKQPQDVLYPVTHDLQTVPEDSKLVENHHYQLTSVLLDVLNENEETLDVSEKLQTNEVTDVHFPLNHNLSPISEEKDNVKQEIKRVTQNSISNQHNEKERRRLEWQNKLAEQKLNHESRETVNLSKAEIKAKRREQQEAQRQAKTSIKNEQKITSEKQHKNDEAKVPHVRKEVKKSTVTHKVQLVQHLYAADSIKPHQLLLVHNNVHPAFVRLGAQYSNKTILGSNARCLALLAALKHLIDDLQTPSKQEFCRYLETVLQICCNYLQTCRPFAVSMTNALRNIKLQLTQIDSNLKDNEKKAKLQDIIDVYINDDIRKADDAICLKVKEKITNGDIILTYGCSSLIRKILLEAHKDGKKFEVIVTDGRPLLEGREMLRRLVVAGVKCTYVLINAVSYVMKSVTKVVLGAHALLTNGYVMSRIGTAQVALVAQAYNKPVLVCCETYKFSERVQTDSFVYNEIDDPNKLSISHVTENANPLSNWKDINTLTPLNLLYDVTPPDFVTAVVTEIAVLPCTSVPVVLRINANETA